MGEDQRGGRTDELARGEVSRRAFLGTTAGSGALVAAGGGPAAAAAGASGALRTTRLTTEHASGLLGTDVARPRFSWATSAPGAGAAQSAYHLRVSTSPSRLPEVADVWDSGPVVSERSLTVEYGGPPLAARTGYSWSVRLRDGQGRWGGWSEPSRVETALLDEGWGEAAWIAAVPDPMEETAPSLRGATWVWGRGAGPQGAPTGTVWFRGRLPLPVATVVTSAVLVVTADDDYTAVLDGREVLSAPVEQDGWRSAETADVTDVVRGAVGDDLVLAVRADNRGGAAAVNPGGLVGRLVVSIEGTTGDLVLVTDGSWVSTTSPRDDWSDPGADEGPWEPVVELAPFGQGVWGEQVQVPVRQELDLRGASWVWGPDADVRTAPEGDRWFRGRLALPAGAEVTSAELVVTADNDFTAFLDGRQVAVAPTGTDSWRTAVTADVGDVVRSADGPDLVLAVRATNAPGPSVNPAGLVGTLLLRTTAGTVSLVTGAGWVTTDVEEAGWAEAGDDDTGWDPVVVLAPYGQGPWGDGVRLPVVEAPAPLLRRPFDVDRPVERARLYVSGLGYAEVLLNGRRVGDSVLDPGVTDYDDTVLYVVHDVTDAVRAGANVIGAELGRGFFAITTPNVWRWDTAPWHAEPRLLVRLVVDHPDGTSTEVVSDDAWRVTSGPTTSNSLYEGESYDARRALPGWAAPGFDDSGWEGASLVSPPRGSLRAQDVEPIRVVDDVPVASWSSPSPGVWVADFGRTAAGWVRLSVTAAVGTTVRLVHGEALADDGTVQASTGNVLTPRFQTDEYTASGSGTESWEPRFSYKGFRYVQVEGLSAAPGEGALVMRVLHTDVRPVGEFRCSEPMLERLERMMRRTVLNNLHSLPTDTPMYEKNGWTGDAQVGAATMVGMMDMSRFFTTWMRDLRDSQVDSGQLPVIVPSGGWGYRELAPAPEWTTVYPYLLREMHRWYGDTQLLEEHFEPVSRYLGWELGRLEDGLATSVLGDWIPPGSTGPPPEDSRLTATAFLHRALVSAAEVGDLLGRAEEPPRWRRAAVDLRERLNDVFLDRSRGVYRSLREGVGYRQTQNAVPLAFGLVPDDLVDVVAANLAADVEARDWHLDTGDIGTSVLLPVLTASGRSDAAMRVALQRTYPSWGYWIENGADTMWEMWETTTRSRDHYFHGTVAQWLAEHVAGLRAAADGWRELVVRPDARDGLTHASYAIDTPRGRAESSWRVRGRFLQMDVVVPPGSTAEVSVPGSDPRRVSASPADVVLEVRTEPGWVVHVVPSGTYRFRGDAAPSVRAPRRRG